MNLNRFDFEQGPIRPPNEARSLLLRLTRNCPWNQCLFCPVFKQRKFSLRTVAEIKQDIQTAKDIANDIKALSWKLGYSGQINDKVISNIFNDSSHTDSYRSIAAWLYYGTEACFLQDADNLIMKTKDLLEVLKFLKEKFPQITRITTYSRSRTVIRKSVESLKQIRAAGLDRVHIGLETGYDPLLKLMKKGVRSDQHIEAGRKLLAAGIELSEYVMPGLGGQEMWREHALET
ncbi:radical SAM protein, partial [Thermodesulfobacteriota bacterium]